MSSSLRQTLVSWLTSMDLELGHRLRRGCYRYSDWRDVIRGSTRNLRKSGSEETISLSLTLHQAKFSGRVSVPNASPYTAWGNQGQDYLQPAMLPPMQRVAGLSYGVEKDVEQLEHVSGSLSIDTMDSEEEASAIRRSLSLDWGNYKLS